MQESVWLGLLPEPNFIFLPGTASVEPGKSCHPEGSNTRNWLQAQPDTGLGQHYSFNPHRLRTHVLSWSGWSRAWAGPHLQAKLPGACLKLGKMVWGSQATLLCTASPGSDLATPFCPFVIRVGQYANMSFYLGFPLLRYEYFNSEGRHGYNVFFSCESFLPLVSFLFIPKPIGQKFGK